MSYSQVACSWFTCNDAFEGGDLGQAMVMCFSIHNPRVKSHDNSFFVVNYNFLHPLASQLKMITEYRISSCHVLATSLLGEGELVYKKPSAYAIYLNLNEVKVQTYQ